MDLAICSPLIFTFNFPKDLFYMEVYIINNEENST